VAGTAPAVPLDLSQGSYFGRRRPEDGRIDWSDPADLIERKIRAFNPWPGTFTHVWDESNNTQRTLKIFSAAVVPEIKREPGTIIYADDRGLVFAAGENALALIEVQLEGARRMHAGELLRGHRWIAQTAR